MEQSIGVHLEGGLNYRVEGYYGRRNQKRGSLVMSNGWTSFGYLDPAIIVECLDNRRACPVCQFNDFTREKNGHKIWYCKLNHNQNNGTQTAESCKDWMRKRVRGYA